jgi:predicted SAM-dependent methyltransferase
VELVPESAPFTAGVMERLGIRGLHVGSALKFRTGWLNTDRLHIKDVDDRTSEHFRIATAKREDGVAQYYLEHDSSEPYPCADATFEWAFAEHLLEHLTPDEAEGWLREVRRVLKPGGLLRVTTPSLAKYVEGYLDPEGKFFAEHRERIGRLRDFNPEDIPTRRAWMVNQIFYRWEHRWIYDLDEIRHAAVGAGFAAEDVTEWSFGESAVEEVGAMDLPFRNDESLYVELRR